MKIREIAEFVHGELSGDGDIEIVRVAALDAASSGSIAFVEKSADEIATNASCLIVRDLSNISGTAYIKVEDPKLAFARIAAVLHPSQPRSGETHDTTVISESASIGKDVFIGAFTCV